MSLVLFQVVILFFVVAIVLFVYSLISLRDSNAYNFLTFECGFDAMTYQHVFANYFVLCAIFLLLEVEYLTIIILVSSSHSLDSFLVFVCLLTVGITILELNSSLL